MNRRQCLAALLALPAVCSGSEYSDSDRIPTDPKGFARWAAEWDLRAIRFNHPADWWTKGYVSTLNWSDDRAAFIGVGPPDWLSDRAARVLAVLGPGPIAGAYRTPCGHALAIVVEGRLTEDCRAEFRRPLWKC